MTKYAIGIDFGTLSARALLVDVDTGEQKMMAEKEYAHSVMDTYLGNTKLEPGWALQHPQDYFDVLKFIIGSVLDRSGIEREQVVGVGVDFTSCSIMPVDQDFVPLCLKKEYRSQPHAYVKLWKHHAAQDEADKIMQTAQKLGYANVLSRYGGRASSENLFPKIWQVLDEAPEIFERAYKFIEAGDWMVYQLTGQEKRSVSFAGYKGLWSQQDGYPPKELLKELDPRLENLVEEKLAQAVYPLGYKAGEIDARGSALTGLKEGTAVSVAVIDALAAMPAAGIAKTGKMLMIMGTSTGHMVLGDREKIIPGLCGVVDGGMIPGFFGFEAGQGCVGDHFSWAVNNCVPASYEAEAARRGVNMHQLLSQKAAAQKPGEHGLLALDWWNGNRSVLMDSHLSGLLIGCTLSTKPEDIYRALIEATAFGTRIIVETFEKHGLKINEIIAGGGIAVKNPFVMQVYADVLGREINVMDSSQASALGSAVFGAVAAGPEKGGHKNINDAINKMVKIKTTAYAPEKENTLIYNKLYAEYKKLYRYFGKPGAMKNLKGIQAKKGLQYDCQAE